jgi:PAS domain S-box-containing protein
MRPAPRILCENAFVTNGRNRLTTSALHRTAEQFHILVDSIEEYAYMLDPEGNVVTWNTGTEKIKGYAAEEIIGKNFACFYTAEDVVAGKPERNLHEAARRGHNSRSGSARPERWINV